jgi:hypothetical protein
VQPGRVLESAPVAAHALALQRRIGNRATVRVLARARETWYRGEAPGVKRARIRGSVHDLTDGLYFTDSPHAAQGYADLRAGTPRGGNALGATFDRRMLGKVLDLPADPRWVRFLASKPPVASMGSSWAEYMSRGTELYNNGFHEFMRQHRLQLSQYDAIIAEDLIRAPNARQMVIVNERIAERIDDMLTRVDVPPAPKPVAGDPPATPPSRGGVDAAGPVVEIEGGRVKLYRAVGPDEIADLARHGDFGYSPHGGGKYFSFTKQDAINAGSKLYPNGVTLVETTVPRAYVPATPDTPQAVHHPHLPARGGAAVMIQGEVVVFYDPRAGGWSLHVDDNAVDVMNSQKTRPKILTSTLPAVSVPPPRGPVTPQEPAGKPGLAPEPPPAGAAAETLAASAVKDDFVPRLADTHDAVVVRPGRYAWIGGGLYAVLWIGGALFLIHDIAAKGPIQAGKEAGLAAVLTQTIAQRAGIGLGSATIVLMLVFMPSDQGGDAERIAKADAIDELIHTAFPGVVSDKKFLCIGDCTAGNREVLDRERYYALRATVERLAESAWVIETDPRAVAMRKRAKYLEDERRREAERDRAAKEQFDQELAAYREAIHRPAGFHVRASVGEDGKNDPDDVRRVSRRLHQLGFLDEETTDLDAIGDAIYLYQSAVLRWRKPDGRVEPRGKTEAAMRAGRKVSMTL